jgi:hypothetical protein
MLLLSVPVWAQETVPPDTIPPVMELPNIELPAQADTIPPRIVLPDSIMQSIKKLEKDSIKSLFRVYQITDSIYMDSVLNLLSQRVKRFADAPLFSGVGVTVDYGKIGSFVLNFETKYEAGVFIRLKNRVQLSADYGYSAINPVDRLANSSYRVAGNYWRAGVDWLMYLDPVNKIITGLRYGRSDFSDRVSFQEGSPFLINFPLGDERTGFSADWAEFVIGSEGALFEQLFIGFLIRYKALIQFNVNDEDRYPVLRIPGYGSTENPSGLGLSLYLRYVIPAGRK